MFYVPLYIEWLRSRPLWLFWIAALTQAALWLVVPALFYSSPPGGLAELLAVGHELRFDAGVGPPLAYWLAEIAFRIAGLFGVYALAQLCVVATYWCVFALGRIVVGPVHAAIAVLLMVGIAVFTVPSPDFNPTILAMALWAATLLFYAEAVLLRRARSWYALGVAAVLLLATSGAGLILLGLLFLFTVATARGRAALETIEPWIVGVGLSLAIFAHLIWLQGMWAMPEAQAALDRLAEAQAARGNISASGKLIGALLVAHAGLVILIILASGWPLRRSDPMPPPLERKAVDPFAAKFVILFAWAPAVAAAVVAVVLGAGEPVGGVALLVVLSGLAVVVAAGSAIALHHQRILGFAWAGLLFVPAVFVPVLIFVLPAALGTELKVAQPATAMGRFIGESFERRTGKPLAIVTGDPRAAALVALTAPSRPSVFFDSDPARSPWVSVEDIRDKGAVVVWLATGTDPTPPPDIKAYFPDLVAELPRAFDRPVPGRLPPLRLGWGVIRPGSVAAAGR
jgi:hypothetical protein